MQPTSVYTDLASLPPLVPLPQAAELLGLSRASAYRYAKAGQLPAKHFGRRVYLLRDRLIALLTEDENPHSIDDKEAA
jgi:predicted site-specific integrase-resolvase